MQTLPNDKQAAGSPSAPPRASRMDAVLVLVFLCTGLLASWYGWHTAQTARELQRTEHAAATARAVIEGFDLDLLRVIEVIRSTGEMIAHQETLTRTEFQGFSTAMLEHVPAVSLLEWQPVVPAAQRTAFEAAARAAGMAGFRIIEPGTQGMVPAFTRDEYVPVLFSEPENRAAIGVDMAFDPRRMASKWLARDARQPAASDSFEIISPDSTLRNTPAFAISHAVFRRSADTRPERLLGYVAGVIQVQSLFREAEFRADAAKMDLWVFDQGADTPQLLFRPARQEAYTPSTQEIRLTVDVGLRPWDIVLHPREDFFEQKETLAPLQVGLTGLAITLILVFALHRLQHNRHLIARTQANTLAAESELADERQRLSNIITGTHAGTWEWQVPTGAVLINERWAQMLGYEMAELMPVDIDTWRRLCHPEDLIAAQRLLMQHFAGVTRTYACDLRMRHKQGHWVTVQARGSLASRTASGAPGLMAGTHIDITESQRASRLLTHLRIALDAHAIVVITDNQGVITYANDKFCEISGYAREEVIGQTHRLIKSGEHPPEFFRALWETISAGRTWQGQICNRAKNGHLYWVDSTIAPILDSEGLPEQYIAIRYDITTRKQIEDAVRANAAFLSKLSEIIPGLLSYWDTDLKCRFANSAYGAWFGLSPERIQGMDLREVVGDEFVATYGPRIQAALRGETQIFERTLTARDGRPHTFWVHYLPDREGDQIRGFFVESTDISDMKAAQYQLETLNTQLTLRTHEAESASQAKSAFLATMSHEIRTPMNGILGMLRLLDHTALTPQQIDYISKAKGATHTLLGIINDILDFSKVEAGRLELELHDIVLSDLLRDLSVILSANQGNKDIEVLFRVAPDLPVLRGDALRLHQVLLNLSGNAIKFTEHGEVLISIQQLARDDTHITLAFSVQDSGIGIPPEKLQYIFEGFSQAESSTARRFGGSGLGLAISKRLVAMMGGELAVESQPGQGSNFHFSLRLPLAATETPHLPAPSLSPGMQGLNVLVVDDNALARDIMSDLVQSLGWHGHSRANAAGALDYLTAPDTPACDLILLDWQMPGMDGGELAQRIRNQPGRKADPLILMVSGHSREQLSAKVRHQAGVSSVCLVKPFTASMLHDAVMEAMNAANGALTTTRTQRPEQALAGLRLLVVEDNPLNQQVARELLEQCGAQVSIADGGISGVEQALAAQPPFDAILMDLQMPDIDGLEATRRLRSHPQMQTVPIIAMTANAMRGDREACLAAGMIDHIAKPIDLDRLQASLLRHTGRHPDPASDPAPASAAPQPPAVTARHDAAILDIDAALARFGGNRELYDSLIGPAQQDFSDHVSQIRAHLLAERLVEATRSAHTLKGSASSIGAMALSAEASRIETSLKALQHDAAPLPGEPAARLALMGQIDDCLDSTLAALRQAETKSA